MEGIMKNTKKGFTLTELVIVIVVTALLAAVLIPTFVSIVKTANDSAALSELRQIQQLVTVGFAGGDSWEFADKQDDTHIIEIVKSSDGKLWARNADDLAEALSLCPDLDGYGGFEVDGSDLVYIAKNGGTAKWRDIVDTLAMSDVTRALYFKLSDNGQSYIISGTSRVIDAFSDITLPTEYNGKPVTAIAASAFEGCLSLRSVRIPASYTSIGNAAFSGCDNLESATFEVTTGWYRYDTIDIFSSVMLHKPISSDKLFDCLKEGGSLFRVVIVTEDVLSPPIVDADGLKLVLCVDDTYSVIGITRDEDTYDNVEIPEEYNGKKITAIAAKAFRNCSNLESINIPASVTSISISAFEGCTRLAEIKVADDNKSYRSIEGNLYNKNGTVLIKYAPGKTDTEFSIPDSVITVRRNAFKDSVNLQSVTVSESVANIEYSVFAGCNALTNVHFVTKSGWKQYAVNVSASVDMSEEVIGDPTSMATLLRDNPMVYLKRSSFILLDPDKEYDENGLAFKLNDDGDSYTLVGVGTCTEEEITIPSEFNGKNVTAIGRSAFAYCKFLESIEIPEGVTSIGASAFSQCKKLKTVSIPSTVTSIGDSAFWWCDVLTHINILEGVTTIGNNAFRGCGFFSIQLPSSLTAVGSGAFAQCSHLASIAIPENVTSIGNSAFDKCTSLKSITIPSKVTTVGDRSFYGCENLVSLTVLDGEEKSIGDKAFAGCLKLYDVTLSDSVTSIGESAFEYCKSLVSIEIPSGVTELKPFSFSSCSSLESITIPSSVDKIGHAVFNYCNRSSVTIQFGGTLTEWNEMTEKDLVWIADVNKYTVKCTDDEYTVIGTGDDDPQ